MLRTLVSSSPLRLHLLPFSFSTATSTVAAPSTIPAAAIVDTTTESTFLDALKKLQKHPQKAFDFYNHAISSLGLLPTPSIHNLMLRTLAAAQPHDIQLLRSFIASSSSSALLPINPGTYFAALVSLKKNNLTEAAAELSSLYSLSCRERGADRKIADVVDALRRECGEGFDERLDALGLSPGGPDVEKILQEVKDKPLAALGFFKWTEKRLGHKHGSSAYNIILRVLARSEFVEEFWDMAEEMKEKGHDLDIDTYIKVMRRFLGEKMLHDAVKLYEVMMDSPCKPAKHECGLLLRQISLLDNPDLNLVGRVINKYESNGYSLSKVEYDGILRSLAKSGEFDEAGKVVMTMKAAGFEPDNITYSHLVFGLCKARRSSDAAKVLLDMEESGCKPDVKTWTVLIQGQCFLGEVDMALANLKNMVDNHCEPDGELLDVLVKGLCCNGRTIDAHHLLVDILNVTKVKPRQATFKYLIEKLLDGRKLEEAVELLGRMKKFKFPPYTDPFPPCIAKFGTVDDAENFLRALGVRGHPSTANYLSLFRSFLKEGRRPEAKDLLFKCPHRIRKDYDVAKLFRVKSPNKS